MHLRKELEHDALGPVRGQVQRLGGVGDVGAVHHHPQHAHALLHPPARQVGAKQLDVGHEILRTCAVHCDGQGRRWGGGRATLNIPKSDKLDSTKRCWRTRVQGHLEAVLVRHTSERNRAGWTAR